MSSPGPGRPRKYATEREAKEARRLQNKRSYEEFKRAKQFSPTLHRHSRSDLGKPKPRSINNTRPINDTRFSGEKQPQRRLSGTVDAFKHIAVATASRRQKLKWLAPRIQLRKCRSRRKQSSSDGATMPLGLSFSTWKEVVLSMFAPSPMCCVCAKVICMLHACTAPYSHVIFESLCSCSIMMISGCCTYEPVLGVLPVTHVHRLNITPPPSSPLHRV